MPIKRVSTTKAGASGRTAATQKAKPKAHVAHKPVAKKADKFGGTTKEPASKPAAQLPRSGWASGAQFAAAAKASRDLAGLQAGGLPERPVIRPLYGIQFPVPIDPNLKDKHLEAKAKELLGDKKISLGDVNKLIGIAESNGKLSKTEKRDLQRLMDNAGQFFDVNALHTLQTFVKNQKPMPDPVIRPLYGMQFPVPLPDDIKGKALKDALRPILGDRKITADEVNQLIDIANKNGGLTAREKSDLGKVYDELKDSFADDGGRFRLGQAIGREPVIRPMYGLQFPVPMAPDLKDKKLEDALKTALGDRKISLAEVNTLIENATANHGLTKTERGDLNKILAADGQWFDADAKTKLTGFLAEGKDGLKVTHARRDAIISALDAAKPKWEQGFPLGERMVEVPLSHNPAGAGDMFVYTALIPVGALAPGAPVGNPNDVKDMWIRKSGGLAGLTEYTQLHVN